jgi:hypothetical protein
MSESTGTQTAKQESVAYGHEQRTRWLSQVWVLAIGATIGGTWLFVGIANGLMGQTFSIGSWLRPQPASPFWVDLVTYSFYSNRLDLLMADLLSLAALITLARESMSPMALIRVYSLGTLSCGLLYLPAAHWPNATVPMVGGGGAVLALSGALTSLMVCEWERTTILTVTIVVASMQLAAFSNQSYSEISLFASLVLGLIYGLVERHLGGKTWTGLKRTP